jgi:hypothetical protein
VQDKSIDILIGVIEEESKNHIPPIASLAKDTCQRFRGALSSFSKCHSIYNGNVLSDEAIEQIGEIQPNRKNNIHNHNYYTELDIASFMAFYRKEFPGSTVLPKMHLLEDHVVPWLKRWNIGAGLIGEQGAESLHAHMHKLENNYATIPNKVDRLRHIFTAYNLGPHQPSSV